MRMTRRTLKHGVLLSILLGCCLAGASPTWEVVTETEGMQVERRLLPGTARYEVRVSTYAPFPPQVIFKTLWRHHEYTAFVPYLKHLAILTHAPDEKMIYEQITMPVVRDRDYTVRVTASAGCHEWPYPGLVRLGAGGRSTCASHVRSGHGHPG